MLDTLGWILLASIFSITIWNFFRRVVEEELAMPKKDHVWIGRDLYINSKAIARDIKHGGYFEKNKDVEGGGVWTASFSASLVSLWEEPGDEYKPNKE